METAISEVVADVAALAAVAENASTTDAILESVIEGAQQRVEQAERTAEQIAEAAMESSRGREIEELRKDISSWQNDRMEIRQQLTDLSSRMETLAGQLSGLSVLTVSNQSPASSLLTPPTSETVQEAIAEVETILPAAMGESVVAESPVPVAPPKRKRWI